MTPPGVPGGSSPRSPGQDIPEIPLSAETSEREDSHPESVGTAPRSAFHPRVGMGVDSSAAWDAGFPFRLGATLRFQPHPYFGFGLRLDGNFSDDLVIVGRAEGILPLIREIQVFATFEAGLRTLFGQLHQVGEEARPLSGGLLSLGGEVLFNFQVVENFGIGIFGRLLCSPEQGVSAAIPGQPDVPPDGISFGGCEGSAGIRVGFDFPVDGSGSQGEETAEANAPEPEPEISPSPPIQTETQRAQEALTQLQRLTDELAPRPAVPEETAQAQGTEVESSSPADQTPVEQVGELREQLRTLQGTFSSLQNQVDAALWTFQDLEEGQRIGQILYMRRDRLHDDLMVARPPRLNPQELSAYLDDVDTALGAPTFRLLLQSRNESFASSFVRNSELFSRHLQRHLRRLRGTDAATRERRAELERSLARLTSQIGTIQSLQQSQEDTQPQRYQLNLWQRTLEQLEGNIEELSPHLPSSQVERLRGRYAALQESFQAMQHRVEVAERTWQTSGAIMELYERFRAERNPVPTERILQEMARQLENTPDEFREVRRRSLENLRRMMEDFIARVDRMPNRRRWQGARAVAIAIIRWINPDYQAPEAATRTRPQIRDE